MATLRFTQYAPAHDPKTDEIIRLHTLVKHQEQLIEEQRFQIMQLRLERDDQIAKLMQAVSALRASALPGF